jgi:hypothetical protein
MSGVPIFERNMLAISSTHGQLASERVLANQPSTRIGFEESRSGRLVPFAVDGAGKSYIHSRMDPEREAQRIAQEFTRTGFYVFFGCGAGYSIAAILDSPKVSKGIIVEYDAAMLRSILEHIDLTHILSDRRLLLLVEPADHELTDAILSRYIPSIDGDLVTVPLRSIVSARTDQFNQAAELVRNLTGGISDDYSVQSFFGKRWFANIVRNLSSAAGPTPPVGPIREAIITAAGPSLEDQLDEITASRQGKFLIATDTSIQALHKRGLQPDAAISIDCQHISYYHFIQGRPVDTPLFVDLASPPTVTRMATRRYFFSSGHPFDRYVASRFRAFPILDTSGGNVTHAAVSLAEYLGAERIHLYGADFSYPFGKSYARGTYIYPYFDQRQQRLKPQEALFADFLYRNQSLDRQCDADGTFRYVTKPLVAYKERLEVLASRSRSLLIRHRGRGVETIMRQNAGTTGQQRHFGRVFAAGRPFKQPAIFLADYLDELAALPEPREPAATYIDGLTGHQRDIWTTLLPSAAAIRREAGQHPPGPVELLQLTRLWCAETVRQELTHSRG